MLETSKIRDKLTEQKTLYQRSLQESEAVAAKIENIIASVSDEDVEVVKVATGLDFRLIRSFDLVRMKTDSEYLKECEDRLNEFIQVLHSYLEDALNV
mgnify:CR=1 FL=1